MAATEGKEETFRVGSDELHAITGGNGRPLLILHDELGYPGWMEWQTALAAERSLLVPLAPGFGQAPRIEWLSGVRDLACLYARLVREQGLAPIDVIGFSFGGWVAAEMAVNDPAIFRKMVLVAPLGVKPGDGEILDIYRLTAHGQLEATVHDPAATPEFGKLYGGEPTPAQFEAFEDARAESARLAWQPYFHNPSLPHLLGGVGRLPTLLLWGDKDRVVPRSAMDIYQRELADAQLRVLGQCGHRPEIEKREEFVNTVRNFLA